MPRAGVRTRRLVARITHIRVQLRQQHGQCLAVPQIRPKVPYPHFRVGLVILIKGKRRDVGHFACISFMIIFTCSVNIDTNSGRFSGRQKSTHGHTHTNHHGGGGGGRAETVDKFSMCCTCLVDGTNDILCREISTVMYESSVKLVTSAITKRAGHAVQLTPGPTQGKQVYTHTHIH